MRVRGSLGEQNDVAIHTVCFPNGVPKLSGRETVFHVVRYEDESRGGAGKTRAGRLGFTRLWDHLQ